MEDQGTWWMFRIFFFLLGGGGRGVRGAGRGGDRFLSKIPRGGAFQDRRGRGARRVSAVSWGILGEGGLNIFFRGRNVHQDSLLFFLIGAPGVLKHLKTRCTPEKRDRHELRSGTKKEHKPKLLSPDIFRWGGGLAREGVGAEKFGMPLETREIKLFWRDIPGFCRNIPEIPEKFEKKKFVFNLRSLLGS